MNALTNKAGFFCVTLFVFTFSNTFSQDTTKSLSVKLYSNFSWQLKPSTSDLGFFSPAVSLALPNGNFHEIELSKLSFRNSRSVTIAKIYESQLKLRYEYNLEIFNKRENQKLQPFIGFSFSPSVSQFRFSPTISTSFEHSGIILEGLFSIVPRINYHLTDRLFLDLNVPIGLARVFHTISRAENPTLSENNRKQTETGINLLPEEFMIRFGVEFRF